MKNRACTISSLGCQTQPDFYDSTPPGGDSHTAIYRTTSNALGSGTRFGTFTFCTVSPNPAVFRCVTH